MNRIRISLFVTALLLGSVQANAQQSPSGSGMPPDTQAPPPQQTAPASPASALPTSAQPALAPGSVIPVQLTKSVDAKKAKTGEEIVARVTQDLRNDAGAIIVPKDTKVIGHITEAQARNKNKNKDQNESQMSLAFDRLVTKSGETMPMPMSIQAVIAPPNSANTSGGQAGTGYSEPGAPSTTMGGRPGMGGNTGGATMPTQGVPPGSGGMPTATQTGPAQPPINGNTTGVVGITNLTLAPASDPTQGSVLSSEKNNVKLDEGTFLLLRVNQ